MIKINVTCSTFNLTVYGWAALDDLQDYEKLC